MSNGIQCSVCRASCPQAVRARRKCCHEQEKEWAAKVRDYPGGPFQAGIILAGKIVATLPHRDQSVVPDSSGGRRTLLDSLLLLEWANGNRLHRGSTIRGTVDDDTSNSIRVPIRRVVLIQELAGNH